MIEEHHQAQILKWPKNPVLEINCAARTCYNSILPDSKKEQKAFVLKLIKHKHETPLEFVQLTYAIFTDRGISHELVRHRLASFQQESTRYVRYRKEDGGIPVVCPTSIAAGSEAYAKWKETMLACEEAYFALLHAGCKPEVARSVLPTSLSTTLWMSMNLRELRHFLTLRLSKRAHPDMQVIARKIVDTTLKNLPDANILLSGCFEDEVKHDGISAQE